MVLPSLKSIKTLFGSPHRRAASHASRKHKEKKLSHNADDGNSKTSPHQIHPKSDGSFQKMVVNKVDESDSWSKNAQNSTSAKETPAKARIAPFNSANDESSTKELIQPLSECDQIRLESEKTDTVKELLENKVLSLEQREDPNSSLIEQLAEERGLRCDAEQRLREISCENQISKERLIKLQKDFTRLEEMLCSLLQYKTRLDWLQKEKVSQNYSYEMKLCKYQNYVANLEKENLMLLTEVKTLEATSKRSDVRERSLSRVLLERLRYLEKENSSLVLETEHQRVQYERCLDDVANQVVQALLTQKSLREECVKLQKRVSDLEYHNRSLSLMFQRHVQMSSETNCQRGKLSPHVATMYSSNQSSMATQTTSQSEDSLESLASLCSEYSCDGNMVIGIPGLPQLSSPPFWIRNCLNHRVWPTSFANMGAMPRGLEGISPEDEMARSSLFDDTVWSGIRSWDDLIDDDPEDRGENVAQLYGCRPLIASDTYPDRTDSFKTKDKVHQNSYYSFSRPPPSILGLARSSRKSKNELKGDVARPLSLNLPSRKLGDEKSGSSLPRKFKFSLLNSKLASSTASASRLSSSDVDNDEPRNGDDKKDVKDEKDTAGRTTQDEGYSTMSSDVLSVEPLLGARNVLQQDLQEETDEEEMIAFANDLDRSLIVVEHNSETGEETVKNDCTKEDFFRVDEEDSVDNFALDAELRIVEEDQCDEFYIPIPIRLSDYEKSSTSLIRTASDSQLCQRSCVFERCASENSLDFMYPTRTVLQRTKRKYCLIDDCQSDEEMNNDQFPDSSNLSEPEEVKNYHKPEPEEEEEEEEEVVVVIVESNRDICTEDEKEILECRYNDDKQNEKSVATDFCPQFYTICPIVCDSNPDTIVNEGDHVRTNEDSSGEDEEEEEEDEEEDDEDDDDDDDDDIDHRELGVEELQQVVSTREKLEELNALMNENNAGDEYDDVRILPDRQESLAKEGCTTSWIHVDMDLTDPKTRANFLDTMMGSSSSSSSGDEAPDYQHLHQLHRHRRHRKATERENCILRYIPPPRPSIIGRRDFFFRYGEQEQAAVASFDFLEDMSTSVSDFGSAETLNAEERRDEDESRFSCSVEVNGWEGDRSSDTLRQLGGEDDSADKLSLSDSCAESFSSSNQSLNTLEG